MKRNSLIAKLTNTQQSPSQQFHEKSNILKYDKHPKKIVYPPEWIHIYAKGYPRFLRIALPQEELVNKQNNIYTLLRNRESLRNYDSSHSASMNELSHLLRFSVGNKHGSERRYYPSAGARYPIETYILPLNTQNLQRGAYHYHIKSHSLEFLWKLDKKEILSCFNQSWIKDSSFLIALTAYFWRNEVKYGDRGYRFTMMEVGHIAQNVYLVSESLGLKCCSIGGFIDKKINGLLDINAEQEAVSLVIACGTKGGEK